jgi:hypothetical protein
MINLECPLVLEAAPFAPAAESPDGFDAFLALVPLLRPLAISVGVILAGD